VGTGHKPGSAVGPRPNFEVVIVDDKDRVLPQGQVGEIVEATGALHHLRRILPHPEVTLDAMRNMWFHCGDRG